MKDYLSIIGVMTGNSLDAADVVLTNFYKDGRIEDVDLFSVPYPEELYKGLKDLRQFIMDNDGDMQLVAKNYADFDNVLNKYTQIVADAVNGLINKSGLTSGDIDLIGFHGQTCAHKPPSVAKGSATYTVQVGDGNRLAELTGIKVAYDFRSDDVMAGGEGAPLAPKHNQHLAEALKVKGDFPITFINGGNTSNLAHTTVDNKGNTALMGWDAGPFNHLPDYISRKYFNVPCDMNGNIGSRGKINMDLLKELFEGAAVKSDGSNFLESAPPKSSDPQWYKVTSMLDGDKISPEDKLRTVEYFAAYITYHTLGHTPDNLELPHKFAVFGGGWKNPIVKKDFESLVNGEHECVLPGHEIWFKNINKRIGNAAEVKFSNDYGFDGTSMEARIFADMARCLITGEPFSEPSTTGVKHSVVCGIITVAGNMTDNLKKWIKEYKTPVENRTFAVKWSRASGNWERLTSKNELNNKFTKCNI